jgi:hypothetical protein
LYGIHAANQGRSNLQIHSLRRNRQSQNLIKTKFVVVIILCAVILLGVGIYAAMNHGSSPGSTTTSSSSSTSSSTPQFPPPSTTNIITSTSSSSSSSSTTTASEQTYTITADGYSFAVSGNISASQISDLSFTTSTTNGHATYELSFVVTGVDGTYGTAKITVPFSIVPSGYTPNVLIDGTTAAIQSYTTDLNNYYVSFTTHFSTHNIIIQFTPTNGGCPCSTTSSTSSSSSTTMTSTTTTSCATWNFPSGEYQPGTMENATVTSTCGGYVQWNLVNETSGAYITSGSFTCPSSGCSQTVIFKMVLPPGQYQVAASFNGENSKHSFGVGDFFVTPEFPLGLGTFLAIMVPLGAGALYLKIRRSRA